MMYCSNPDCPMDRVFDGASHGFCCPACGRSLMLSNQQLFRGGAIFLLLAAFGGVITWMVLSDSSWGEIVRLDSPLTSVMLTVAALFCAFGLMFGTTQLLVYFKCRREEKLAALALAAEQAAVAAEEAQPPPSPEP